MMIWTFFAVSVVLVHKVGYACALSSPAGTITSFSPLPSLAGFDYSQNDRLPWIESGYGTWEWENDEQKHKINYLELGDSSKPALLLIHGFGASSYHFRYNIPELARDYHVFAFDKIGFGLSDKPIMDYSAELWRNQTVDFIEQVIGKPCAVAGNSIGGYTALYAAATTTRDLINGCVLLNAAGEFKDPEAEKARAEKEAEPKNPIVEAIASAFQRAVIAVSFIVTKQPARIEQVLRQVYPMNADNVDDELVDSIQLPSQHPNAAEVFYRVIVRGGAQGKRPFIDDLLATLDDCPLLLCWGEYDPWIRSAAADRIQSLYPKSRRVSINGGHCPHDECFEEVNVAIADFLKKEVATA